MEGPSTSTGISQDSAEAALSNYIIGRTLGIGTFGKVKLAEHVSTGQQVAVKILKRTNLTDAEREKVNREIKILRLLVHPHIIRLQEFIETETHIYVFMEYVDSGELFDYITEKGRVEENEARFFFQQIISGVEFCHRNKVVHRDLKPENLLLDSNHNIKIADFGLANFMRDGYLLKTSCGSPNYAAPEVISGNPYAGPEVDVWSCGVILYALLCGTLPFDAESVPLLYKSIKNGVYTLPRHLPAGARDLIPRMLTIDPVKRITIPEIRKHLWFQNHFLRSMTIRANEGLKKKYMYSTQLLGHPHIGHKEFPNQQRLAEERNWTLGLQFHSKPSEVMAEVLGALQRLNICWKKLGNYYNIKCRWLPSSTGCMIGSSTTSTIAVKFEMQLYKVKGEEYLLDLQRVDGPPLLFLEICAAFLSQFHPV